MTDAALKELVAHDRLTDLNLGHTGATDAGMREVAKLANQTELDLGSTAVTDAGTAELRAALPRCKITR